MDNNENNNNMPGGQQNADMGNGGGSAGPIIGVIVILVIIILGGLYFWGQRGDDSELFLDDTSGVLEDINTQGEGDDPASIEADLDATDVDGVDSEINAS